MSVRYFGRKRKKQKFVEAKSGLVRMKVYLEINNRVKYFYRIFFNATSFTPNFWDGYRALIPMSRL